MKEINLRNLFPEYELDCFVEVPDEEVEAFTASMTKEVAAIYFEAEQEESSFQRRKYRSKAHYSLDAGDGIEHDALYKPFTPHEVFERMELLKALYNLPEKQRSRIYKHYFNEISKVDIARIEGVTEKPVRVAIKRGLQALKKYYEG